VHALTKLLCAVPTSAPDAPVNAWMTHPEVHHRIREIASDIGT
jgi:hypothetical protein